MRSWKARRAAHRQSVEGYPMSALKLGAIGRHQLEDAIADAENPRRVRRAQALLWVDAGVPVIQVARCLGVSRQTVYNWIGWLDQCRGSDAAPLGDLSPSGRPRTKSKILDEVVPQLLSTHPRNEGFYASGWTNLLLRDYLLRRHHLEVSAHTLASAVKRAGYRWERTRYVLCRSPAR